jgi:hypothetical protein
MSDFGLQLARRFQPRHILIACGAVLALFIVLDFGDAHGLSSLRFFDLNDSDVAHRISLSGMVIGGLLLGAAGVAFSAAASMRGSRAGFWFRASAVLFALFGVEEILGLHTWAHQHGVSWNVSYLPFVAIATLVWVEMARHFESRQARYLSLLGVGAFLAACLFDAARAGDGHAYAVGEILEMAGASLLLVSLVIHAHAYRPAYAAEPGRRGDLAVLAELVHRLDPVKLAIGAAAGVVLLGVMGSISHSVDYMRVFDVNKEQNYASVFSGLALWAAALMAVFNGLVRQETVRARRWWLALAFVFVYLGLDEMTALHEELQHVTGIWGQSFLLPVVVVGVAAWFIAIQEMRSNEIAVLLWVAGAAAWVVSQGIDLVLNDPMPWTMIPEELGEMTGSLLFAFSLLVALRPLMADSLPAAERAAARPAPKSELQPVQ